jgi:hypothetical protein
LQPGLPFAQNLIDHLTPAMKVYAGCDETYVPDHIRYAFFFGVRLARSFNRLVAWPW